MKDLVEAKARNIQAQRELESYNTTGKFLNKHPLLSQYGIKTKYTDLHNRDSREFLAEYAKVEGYIGRYKSRLNSKKRNDDLKARDQRNLKKYEEIRDIMLEVQDENRK